MEPGTEGEGSSLVKAQVADCNSLHHLDPILGIVVLGITAVGIVAARTLAVVAACRRCKNQAIEEGGSPGFGSEGGHRMLGNHCCCYCSSDFLRTCLG